MNSNTVASPKTPVAYNSSEIAAYYSQAVPSLKQTGSEWRGPCPVHTGRRDSFAVDPQTGRAYCHSDCAKGWDIPGLEQELTGASFVDALKRIDSVIGRDEQRATRDTRPAEERIIAEYTYEDESGRPLFQCVRLEPKDFRQRRPDGKGGWIRNVKGVRLVPYRLPKVLASPTVYIVEGEKDVHSLEAFGLVASCNPMGAGKWRAEYSAHFAEKEIIILPDQDAPGQAHAASVARALLPLAASVRVVNVPHGKDASEWIKAGGTAEELRQLVAQCAPIDAPPAVIEAPAIASTGGLVQKIERALKAETHFARDKGDRLYVFEGGCYQPTGERFVRQAVKKFCETTGAEKSWTPELTTRVVAWITDDAPELMERPPLDTLNVRNGLLDVASRVLRPHSPDFLSPVQIDADFDVDARCLAIEQFNREVFPEDSRHIPWEIAAWLMLPDTSIQKAILAIGEGANGKSVFLNLLQAFLGSTNVAALSLHKIELDRFAAARLVGKLANVCPDLPTSALSGTSMFKALTGGDTINAERKFESSFEFQPYARLVFSANSLPRSDDATHGFFRRWLVIPFKASFAEDGERTVPRAILDARLQAPGELSGMLNRALDALPQIRSGKFSESRSTRDAWDSFRRTTDPLACWLDANIVVVPEGVIPKDTLRRAYSQVCQDAGRPILADEQFTAALKRLRPQVECQRRFKATAFPPVPLPGNQPSAGTRYALYTSF
jgi:putative DNA primase/helicase